MRTAKKQLDVSRTDIREQKPKTVTGAGFCSVSVVAAHGSYEPIERVRFPH